ncbi:MAG: hypothetical protein ABSE42_11155 [Bryobacteraceae bacterium]|jgi:hypothetical protein
MRYWGYLCAKVVVAAAALYWLLFLVCKFFPNDPHPDAVGPLRNGDLKLLCVLALMGWFLAAAGALYLIVWDQRHRCRTCLRRLRMPVAFGSWGSMLQLGRPQIEYICAYGHGTLKEEALQITGLATPEWKAHSDDFWEELSASSRQAGKNRTTGELRKEQRAS